MTLKVITCTTMLLATSCSGVPYQAAEELARHKADAASPRSFALTGGIDAAASASVSRHGEDRSVALQSAQSACRSKSPEKFLDSFIRSPAVRQKYTGPGVDYVREENWEKEDKPDAVFEKKVNIAFQDYGWFPIRLVGPYYKPNAELSRSDEDLFSDIEIQMTLDKGFKVKWTLVRFVGLPEDGSKLGKPYHVNGVPYYRPDALERPDGILWFVPTKDCWLFLEDRRLVWK